MCAKKCKSSCIDTKTKTIDHSRCVNCFNCINACNKKGMTFATVKNKKENLQLTDEKKRQFLLTGLSTVITIPATLAQSKAKSFFTKKESLRENAITPPGSVSAEHLLQRCTSCHLCISRCPSKVLKPAFTEYGFGGIMQPTMCFEKGFCNFNCTLCSKICPNGALLPLTKEQKHKLQVGQVVLNPALCVVHTNGTNCGACSEHCPTQAVKMIPYRDGLTIPVVDTTICVGCGGCEFICPVRPHRAIYVEGNPVHQQIADFAVEEKEEKEITDFGF